MKSLGLDPDAEERRRDLMLVHWEKAERSPVLDLLAAADARHAVVLGDPGAGKSSLARYLVLQLLDAPPEDPPLWRTAISGRLPLLIELRDYIAREAEGKCTDLLGHLAYLGEHQGFGLTGAQIEQVLREPTLLILDGLDEIFETKARSRIAREITGLAARFAEARVLVTSRIAGFDAHLFEAAGFAIHTLDDLEDGQIEAFAKAWLDLAFEGQPRQALRSLSDLKDTLRDRPNLKVLAGNPLLLTIMVIVAQHERLARSRAKLYEQALKVLVHGWDLRKELELPADSPLRDLGPDDKIDLLRRVAWQMQEAGGGLRGNAIGEGELKETVEEYLAQEWGLDRGKCRRGAAEMIDLLQRRNWILTPRGPQLYGFVHRTFLEYLCAAELVHRFGQREIEIEVLCRDFVVTKTEDDAWHEVIRLLAAQLPLAHAAEIVVALTPKPERAYEELGLLALACQCLAERETRELGRLRSVCVSLIECIYAAMMRFGDHRDYRQFELEQKSAAAISTSLAALGSSWPDSGIFLRAKTLPGPRVPYHAHPISLVCSVVGVARADERTRPLLRVCAVEDVNEQVRHAALSALAQHWRDDPETLTLIRGRAIADGSDVVRRAALSALAERWRDDPETLALLQKRAVEDEGAAVRGAALSALAEHWRDDPETLALLQKRAVEDEDQAARSAALRALVAQWHDGQETPALLRGRAVADEHYWVRSTALRALAEHWRDDPETLALLQRRAVEDEDEQARGVALSALAEHWRDHPGTLDLLRSRAVEDEDQWVRTSVLWALAKHWQDDPETLDLMRRRAVEDEGAEARGEALRALAEHWRDDPETLALLQWRAVEDEGEEARGAALSALAEHWRDHPETLALLQRRAVEDEGDEARGAALSALAEHWRDHPETLALLRRRAVEDQGLAARSAALLALAEHWLDHPETLALLRRRAIEDDSDEVRRTAVLGFADFCERRGERMLLMQDLGALHPGIDPRQAVDAERVRDAAQRLKLTEAEVRATYEKLAEWLPLTLGWKMSA